MVRPSHALLNPSHAKAAPHPHPTPPSSLLQVGDESRSFLVNLQSAVAQQAPQADLSGVWGLLEAQQEQAARLLGDALPGMSALVEDRVGGGGGGGGKVVVCVLACWCWSGVCWSSVCCWWGVPCWCLFLVSSGGAAAIGVG